MPALSDDERRILRVLNARGKFMGFDGQVDIEAVARARPLVAIIGEGPGPSTWSSCSLFPYPKGSAGWRLWKLSGLGGQEYLCLFERRNLLDTARWDTVLARRNARSLRDTFAKAGVPLVLLGTRVAEAFGHGHPAFQWNFNQLDVNGQISYQGAPAPPMVRVPHPSGRNLQLNTPEAKQRMYQVLRDALEISKNPPFVVVHGDQVLPCGTRAGVHERHPTRPELRILCVIDEPQLGARVVMPHGGAS